VLVYDERSETRNGTDAGREMHECITRLAKTHPTHDEVIDALIAFGVFESAVADALCPVRDDLHVTLVHLRAVAEFLGVAAAASASGDRSSVVRATEDALGALVICNGFDWPELQTKVPEGYAYYSLYPDSYADAVSEWAEHARPDRALVIGIRNIGTSLSAIVTGALKRLGVPARSWTVRPRGHAFDRRVDLAPDLVASLDPAGCVVLIVDEGPGLSGSSMAGTAAACSALGIPDARILFVPSWNPDPARFVSAAAALRWRQHRAIVPSFDRIRRTFARDGIIPADAREVSAGRWREWLQLTPPWPASHPQHERRKYVFDAQVARFAGLGAHGGATAERAAALAEAGWSPAPIGVNRGFLISHVVEGTPMRAGTIDEGFLRHAAAYAAWLREESAAPGTAQLDPLMRMLLTNTREALGAAWLPAAEALVRDASVFDEPATAVDGRMQPHEWLAARGGGWVKTDSLDHHRDHFFPGCTDAAWDVAGFVVEFDLPAEGERFAEEYARYSGDRQIYRRLPFFLTAYTAFRVGYCSMAAQGLAGTEEGSRFEALLARYRARLRVTLGKVRPGAPSVG
jgi:hypothetical protein